MPLTKGAMTLVAEAEEEVDTLTPAAAMERSGSGDCVIVDLREIRERLREGFVPGSLHVPRGMLEFWIDPETPYYKDVFGSGKHFVLYCQSGWRSALAAKAVQDMGLSPVSHIGGGFAAWVDAGGKVLKTADGREPRPQS